MLPERVRRRCGKSLLRSRRRGRTTTTKTTMAAKQQQSMVAAMAIIMPTAVLVKPFSSTRAPALCVGSGVGINVGAGVGINVGAGVGAGDVGDGVGGVGGNGVGAGDGAAETCTQWLPKHVALPRHRPVAEQTQPSRPIWQDATTHTPWGCMHTEESQSRSRSQVEPGPCVAGASAPGRHKSVASSQTSSEGFEHSSRARQRQPGKPSQLPRRTHTFDEVSHSSNGESHVCSSVHVQPEQPFGTAPLDSERHGQNRRPSVCLFENDSHVADACTRPAEAHADGVLWK